MRGGRLTRRMRHPVPSKIVDSSTATTIPLQPARLSPGARVALIAPAGAAAAERVDAALRQCRQLGLEPVLGAAARNRLGYLADDDAARARDLQGAIDDPAIDAIWAIRGGYGTMRILDRIDWTALRRRPRPFIGFSDNTAVHLALAGEGLISFHGPHAGGPFPSFTRSCFASVLFDAHEGPLLLPPGCEPLLTLQPGHAEGRLLGGNLTLLAALCGTRFALRSHGRVVLIEDVREPAYRIDRALTQLLMSGAFAGAAGFAIGQFSERESEPADHRLEDVCAERLGPLGVPVLCGLPFGHVDAQWCVPLGVRARLDANAQTLELLEPGVV